MHRKKTNITVNSNKIQPLLNASKAWQSIPAGSLKKREPSIKRTKKQGKQSKSSNRNWQAKN